MTLAPWPLPWYVLKETLFRWVWSCRHVKKITWEACFLEHHGSEDILLWKAEMRYLLTSKVSRYQILSMHGIIDMLTLSLFMRCENVLDLITIMTSLDHSQILPYFHVGRFCQSEVWNSGGISAEQSTHHLTLASPGDDVYAPDITGHSSNESHFIETANRNVSRSSRVSIWYNLSGFFF